MQTEEINLPVIEIEARTEKKLNPIPDLKKLLINLLADPDVQRHLYDAIVSEASHRENRAKTYR